MPWIAVSGFPKDSGDYIPYGRDQSNIIACHDPFEFGAMLTRCDIIISHKLHVGLVAAMGGAKFISVSGHPKVKAQLNLLGLDDNILGVSIPNDKRRLFIPLGLIISILAYIKVARSRRISDSLRSQLASQSKLHFKFLNNLIDAYEMSSSYSTPK
jgi:polysaccharide pyruvyl transferase WcaK-like protein